MTGVGSQRHKKKKCAFVGECGYNVLRCLCHNTSPATSQFTDVFTYIFLVYYVLLEYFTIVYTTFIDTITCRRNYGLFHYGCET
jgi:hypothetical protein